MEDELSLHAPYDNEFNPDGEQQEKGGAETQEWVERRTVKLVPRSTRPSRQSRWDKPSALENAARKIDEEARRNHWGSVTIPAALWRQVQLARRRFPLTPEQWAMKIAILQKILFADQACQTSTPTSVLEQIVWEI